MPQADINYWAILAAVAMNMVIGYLWYAKPVFGSRWMVLIGKTEEQLKPKAGISMGFMVILAFILAFVLSHVVDYVQATTFADAVVTGLWLWFGFVFTTKGADYLFSQKPRTLFGIDVGFHLVEFLSMATILTLWT